ncbi:DDB1- and CUL4-associated factor 13 [Nematocida major]|uniref:DDB1- and CUL4-associated factor 13 n=1 Tax=Nematocida major TaxID=1912982 RepID=UPI002007A1C1|nr:DDB1- and CUL4-associated factor 13 [Nematocida major]KAH9386307.1 DDB1- and CUL4-associated factor 13 [Nematocida major]
MGILRMSTLDRGSKKSVQPRVFSDAELTQNEKHKEYVRAIKEVKMDHLFRKPFVGCLDGHSEGVTRIVKSDTEVALYASASYDGSIKVWDMSKRREIETISLSQATPVAISFSDSALLYSRDAHIVHRAAKYAETAAGAEFEPGAVHEAEFVAGSGVLDIIGDATSQFYAATVDGIEIFDSERIKAVSVYKAERQAKRIYKAKDFQHVLYTVEGNKIAGYDSRTGRREVEIVARSEINALSIDPSCPSLIATGTNSGEVGIYNTRYVGNSQSYLSQTERVLRGHTSAITDIQHSANGTRIVTGSVDRTVRIFSNDTAHRQEALYHNKRMQAVNAVCCTSDNAHILSGSIDANIRIWKLDPNASAKICTRTEEDARALGNIIKNKYKNVQQIVEVKRHQIVPSKLKKAMKNRYSHIKAEARREERRQENSPK